MLREHFIEPELLAEIVKTRRDYNDFKDGFKASSPRIFSRIRKINRFRSAALKYLGESATEEQKARLIELIKLFEMGAFVNRDMSYDGQKTFSDNAYDAHKHYPASEYWGLNKNFEFDFDIEKKDIDELREDGIQSLQTGWVVEKNINAMLNCFGDFLRLSKDIFFIDPYISDKPASFRALLAFIRCAQDNPSISKKRITIFYDGTKENLPSPTYLLSILKDDHTFFKENLEQLEIASLIPSGSEVMHNRYILSEAKGIYLGYGLSTKEDSVTDDVGLLDRDNLEKRWLQYCKLGSFRISESDSIKFSGK